MLFDLEGARRAGYRDEEIAGLLAARQRFDLEGARRAGYRDEEIAGLLAARQRFDLEGTRRAGYRDEEIIALLAGEPPAAEWGEVVKSLPAQFVAGTRSAAANLRRMAAEEAVLHREAGLKRLAEQGPEQPARMTLTRGGQPVLERPTSVASNLRTALAEDRTALEQAKAEAEQTARAARLVTPENMTIAQEALSSLAQSSGPTLLGIAAGILTRNIPAAIAIAGGGGAAQQAGATYGEARERGAPHRQASVAATIDAVLEGAGEALPLGYALKPGTPIFRRIFGTLAREAGQESAVELAQGLRAKAMEKPDLTFAEVWRNLRVAALAGAGGGAVYGGAGAAANWSRQREAERSEAKKAAAVETILAAPSADQAIQAAAVPVQDDAERAELAVAVQDALESVEAEMQEQAGWLDARAKALGYQGVDDLFGKEPAAFERLANEWRAEHPQYAPHLLPLLPSTLDPRYGGPVVVSGEIAEAQAAASEAQGLRESAAASLGRGQTPSAFPEAPQAQPGEPRTAIPRVETAALSEAQQIVADQAEQVARSRTNYSAMSEATLARIAEQAGPASDGARAEIARRAERAAPGVNYGALSDGTLAKMAMRRGLIAEGARAEIARRRGVVSGPETELAAQVHEAAGTAQGATREVPPIAPPRGEEERPAGTAIRYVPAYTGTAEQPVQDAKRARPDVIRQQIRELFRVPINEGYFKKSRDTLGLYKVKAQAIRVRNQNDIGVIAHELGHHLSEISRPIREARKNFDRELRTITPYAASQKSAALQREEGMAEFVRFYLTEPAQAKAKAPGFFAAFERYVEGHGYRPALNAISGAIRDWQNLPPAERIFAKVGEGEPEFRKRWNLDRIVFEVFDRWLPLKRMVADLKPEVSPSADPFKLAHLLSGDAAIIEDWLLRETIPFDFRRRANTEDRGKPLAEILKPVEDQQREFGAYLIAKRANELMKRGKEHLYSPDEISAGLRLETPEFKKAAEEIYAYQDRLLDYAVEGGLLSEYIADKFRQFPFYVPFFRVGEPIGRRSANIFKEIRGGTENLRDPIANIIENTVRIIHATNRNFVLAKAHDLARSVPGGGRWIEDVPMPERAVKVETQKVVETLREQGIEVDTSTAEAIAQMQTFFVKNPFGEERDRVIVIRRGGRAQAIQINDDMLWHALERFEPVDMGMIEKILAVPSDLLRAGVVLSPDFMARNFARDTLSGALQSKTGILPVAGTVNGFKEILTRSDAARLYRAFGGAYGDMWRADTGMEHLLVERMARHGGFDPRTIVTPRGLLSLLYRLGSLTEAGTRVAEFKRTMKPGDIDSLIEAAYRAREVSVDFGMHGHSRTVRFLTRITPFMNPALQGWYKAARTAREQPLATAFRGGMLAVASIVLFLNNRDEEWYDEIEQWEKNVYWHLDIGLRDKQGQVIPLRIPKPFEWGGFFGSVPEALAKVAVDQNGAKFAKRLESIADDVFTFRVIPQAITVPSELWANRSIFTGRPIVPESKERLAPELQATPGTSLTAREVGKLTGTSPAKIDHAVRGFFGTLGTYTLMLADQALRQSGDYSHALPVPWQRAPVVKVFFRDPSGANSRHVTEFYDLLREARRAEGSLKYLPPERMADYYEKHKEEIGHARSGAKVARMMAELRRENEQLRESRDLPPEERARIIVENNRVIRWLARDYMREAERMRKETR